MICQKEHVLEVKKIVEKVVPSSQFLESSGDSGGMVFNVPMKNVKELGPIFSIMNVMIQKKTMDPNISQQEKLIDQMKTGD